MSNSINKVQPDQIGLFNTMIASGPVIIQKRDGVFKTFLVKHGDRSTEELRWKFCGGKILKGESLEQCAIREANQEIGVKVKIMGPLIPIILWQEVPESGQENPQAIVLIHYYGTIDSEPVQGEEIKAMEWFNINSLPEDCALNVAPVIQACKEMYLK